MQQHSADSVPNPSRRPFTLPRIEESPFHAVRTALREVRASLGQTQAVAYFELDCSPHEYERWEYSKALPSFVRIVPIIERELQTIGKGVPVNMSLTIIGRIFSEALGHDPDLFRYVLGRLATLAPLNAPQEVPA